MGRRQDQSRSNHCLRTDPGVQASTQAPNRPDRAFSRSRDTQTNRRGVSCPPDASLSTGHGAHADEGAGPDLVANLCLTDSMSFLTDKNILITGGTGSFGQAFCSELLAHHKPRRIVVFSRDEMKQWDMAKKVSQDSPIRFFIGDVRDRDRLYRAFQGIDVVIHAAAYKIVPTAEYNPFESVKTNVLGAMNVIDAAIDAGVCKVVALSTDKASSPINLYGATKLVSDKLFTASNRYSGSNPTRFSVVRYGNVMGSRGSVIPFFRTLAKEGRPLPITDKRMTRFMIRLEDGVSLVSRAIETMNGGEIFVSKVPSMGIMDIAEAIDPGGDRQFVGIRPGEKLHEQMISPDEASSTEEFDDFYLIHPTTRPSFEPRLGGAAVPENFRYASDTNPQTMTRVQLQEWLREQT